ncbi:MAG: RnfABCDGE type electron transport complex subunit D [Sedimentisphaerales bacterium]|nr:RnfABCDGE type electron transport complex subunit D [Sedimentisphaerales bacterium]
MKSNSTEQYSLPIPPFRPSPESARRIMRTQLAGLTLPVLAAVILFGSGALKLILTAALTALLIELIAGRIKRKNMPGNITHSIMMGVLLAFTLPAECPWYIAMTGSGVAVLMGKQLFGGLGRYRWHPALVGRLVVQLLFHEQIAAAVTGTGLSAATPLQALCNWGDLRFVGSVPQLGLYLYDKLPSLQQCQWSAAGGGLGESCRVLLILIGLYFIYRGYLHWQLPLMFIVSAYAAAAFFPIIVEQPGLPDRLIYFPLLAENLSIGFTYINYHLFTGGLILTAFIMTADMTSRPLTVRVQIYFAVGAGLLTIAVRLYCPAVLSAYLTPISAYIALLIMNTLVPTREK